MFHSDVIIVFLVEFEYMMEDFTKDGYRQAYRIYLGGISKQNEEQELKEFFSSFGDIHLVERVVKKHATSGSIKSFYLLSTFSKSTYNSIIGRRDTVYKNRKLFCFKYMTGQELFQHNSDFNKRRFLVKFVPKEISEVEVKQLIETACSPTEKIYRLESGYESSHAPHPSNYNDQKAKYRTYGLLFADSLSASQYPDSFDLYHPNAGWMISIHRYYYVNSCNSPLNEGRINRPNSKFEIGSSDDTNKKPFENGKKGTASMNQKRVVQQTKQKKTYFDFIHFVTPTKKLYRKLKKRSGGPSSNNSQIRHGIEDQSNIRFNLVNQTIRESNSALNGTINQNEYSVSNFRFSKQKVVMHNIL